MDGEIIWPILDVSLKENPAPFHEHDIVPIEMAGSMYVPLDLAYFLTSKVDEQELVKVVIDTRRFRPLMSEYYRSNVPF